MKIYEWLKFLDKNLEDRDLNGSGWILKRENDSIQILPEWYDGYHHIYVFMVDSQMFMLYVITIHILYDRRP